MMKSVRLDGHHDVLAFFSASPCLMEANPAVAARMSIQANRSSSVGVGVRSLGFKAARLNTRCLNWKLAG
jgi:hypothetical protein